MMILQILSAFSAVLVFTMILEIPEKIYALCVRLGCGGLVGLPDGPEQRPFVYAGSVFIHSGGGLFKSYPGQGQKRPR